MTNAEIKIKQFESIYILFNSYKKYVTIKITLSLD